ncbi:MAG: hypothetical protein MHPSP_003226, partial [Paramarteilia canceri]
MTSDGGCISPDQLVGQFMSRVCCISKQKPRKNFLNVQSMNEICLFTATMSSIA